MKTSLKKNLPAIIISAILLVVFVLSSFMIKNVQNSINNVKNDIIASEQSGQQLEVYKQFFLNATFSDPKAENYKNENGTCIESVDAIENGNKVGIIYLVKVNGYKPDLHVYVAIDTVNRKIVNYALGQNSETPDKINSFTNNFKNQFVNSDITDPSLTYNPMATVTFSTKGIINAVLTAREAYYESINEEVPVISVTVEEMKASLEQISSFELVISKEEVLYNLVLSYSAGVYTPVSGHEVFSETELDYIITIAKTMRPNAYIKNIENDVVTISSKGYGAEIIINFVIENGSVKEMNIDPNHNQSYDIEYNYGYNVNNGDPITDFPKDYINTPNWEDYNVSGATITTTALKDAYRLVLDYLQLEEGQ